MILLSWLLIGSLAADDRGLRRSKSGAEAELVKRVRDAGFVPVPALSAAIVPGALVMAADGSVFLSRQDCFPEAEVSESSAALPESARSLSGGLSLSLEAVGGLLGGRLGGGAEQHATVSFQDVAVRGVSTGALSPSASCLEVLNRQRAAGVGLESYLLITEVLQADGVTVKTTTGLAAEAETDGLAGSLSGLGGGLSVTSQSETGFTATGRVTLGYRCRQLVGHQADGDVENAGQAEACTGFVSQ